MAKTREKEQTEQPPVQAEHIPAEYRRPTLAPLPDSTPDQWATNFDLATPAGKAGLLNAGNPPVWRPQDGGEKVIKATNYVVMPGESVDEETGDISQYTLTVFIDAHGQNVKLSSDWAPRRLRAMLALYGADDWKRGIIIQCYAGKSRRGGRMYGSFRILASLTDTKE